MTIDPELATLALAFGLAGSVTLGSTRRGLVARRRAKRMCIACGRRLVRGQPTCDCRF